MLIAGTAVSIAGRAVLLLGPSKSGKSDLALRLIESGSALISDDIVNVKDHDGWLHANALPTSNARLAVRGIGVCEVATVITAPLALALNLVQKPIPDSTASLSIVGPWYGCHIPAIEFYPFDGTAIAKARLALDRFGL